MSDAAEDVATGAEVGSVLHLYLFKMTLKEDIDRPKGDKNKHNSGSWKSGCCSK